MEGSELSVSIEPLRSGHAALLFELLRDEAIYEFLDELRPESVQQLEQRHAFMLNPDSAPPDERWLNWLVVANSTSWQPRRQVVGTVQATIHLDKRQVVVAYIIAPHYWGRGIATRAVELMLDELVKDHPVKSAQAYIDPANRRSIALVERLGFVVSEDSPDRDGNVVYERSDLIT